jgi:hypothetical protein
LELGREAAELALHVVGGDGFAAALPAVAQRGKYLGGELRDLHRSAGFEQGDGALGDHGRELLRREPGAKAAYGLDLVAGGLGGAQDTVGQADQPDVAQQVVEHGQRLQVFLDRGGPFQRVPARSLFLHGSDHRARQSAAGSEPDAAGEQVEQQPDAAGDDADRIANSP